MRKIFIGLFLISIACVNMSLFAQQNDKKKVEFEKFKEKRVAFITRAMNLNAEEAKVFWPLSNELQEKKFELNKPLRKALRDFNLAKEEGKTYTEAEYKKMVDLCADVKLKEAQLDKEYIEKLSKVISAEKIFFYQRAEHQFARKMLEEREKQKKGKEK